MTPLDWTILGIYFCVLLGVGLLPSRKGTGSTDEYFVGGRRLPWWIAGTSLIAASFASDTPLLVSGLVRSQGVWGNWQWWGLGISSVITVFLFAPLWRSAAVVTDAELTELRYSGQTAAVLRGVKAVYWGVLVNLFTTGAWAMNGFVKVTGAVTGLERTHAIWMCAVIGTAYAIVSGLWGLVLTDMLQFGMAIVGGLLLAGFALHDAGGLGVALDNIHPYQLQILPTGGSGLKIALPYLLIQWWAWKNTDGSGVMVQRWASCKNEKHALGATLWFCFVHYGLRCWPWILVGIASVTLVKDTALPLIEVGGKWVPDHEAAYALVIKQVLPAGLRGMVIAWFFAEFMGSVAQAMSWGGSLLVNDLYVRFIRPDASVRRSMWVARGAGLVIMAGAMGTAYLTTSITTAFDYVLKGTAAVGVVAALRWLWWRMTAWSEIVAMVLSPIITFWGGEHLLLLFGVTSTPMSRMLAVICGAALPAVLVSLVTEPDDPLRLEAFYRRVRPPSFGWGPIARACPEVRSQVSLGQLGVRWAFGLAFVYGTMFAVGGFLLRQPIAGTIGLVAAVVGGAGVWLTVSGRARLESSAPAGAAPAAR